MEGLPDGIPQSSYSVLAFPASKLPGQYLNLILTKWMRSLKYGNDYFKLADSDTYYAAYQKYIATLFARPDSTIRLAVLSDDHDVVLGWSLIEHDILHYVHVQHEHRNKGIAKFLVPAKINWLTHLTKSGMNIWHNKLPNAKFNPFA